MRRREIVIPAIGLGLFSLAYVLFPAAKVVEASLSAEGGVSASRLIGLLDPASSANLEAVTNSVVLSLLSVLFSAALGCFLAFVLTQVEFPFRSQLERLAVLPIALPPLVGVIAFLFAFGESGVVPRILGGAFGMGRSFLALDGMSGILAVHVYSFNVYFVLFFAEAFRKIDGSLLEAAEGLGAGHWRIFRQVMLPHLRPAFISGSILTFMASMASFSAPYLLGGGMRFLTLQIFTTKVNGEIELAAAQSILLAIVSVVFFAMFSLFARREGPSSAGKGVPRQGVLRIPSGTRGVLIGAVVMILAAELLPLAMVALLAFAREGAWTTQILPPAYTVDNFGVLITDAAAFEPIWNSFLMAAITVVAGGILGVAGAYVVERGGGERWKIVADLLLTFPYAVPGTVVGIALILAFNAPSIFSGGAILVGSFWILPLAYVVRLTPLVLRSTSAALARVDGSVIEAAESLGARSWRRFRTILFPLVLPGFVSGLLLVAVAALGEFVTSILLYTYSNRPISVETLAQLRAFNIGAASAYSLVLLAIVVCIASIAGRLSRGPDSRRILSP